jgi:prepilin-type N-terminal cleavage/methylation domain-containing protein
MPLCSQRRRQYFIRRAIENIMSSNDRDKEFDVPAMRTHQSGFSLVELIIVCVVMLIIAGIAVPNIFRIYQNYQLDAAGHSVASLLQQARMQAVKTNLPAYANFTNAASGNIAFVSTDNSTTYAVGEPDIQLSPAVSFQTAPPDHGQLDAYVNNAAPVVGLSIGFNARGLPCAESGGNPTVCPATTTGFEWFMQSAGGWEALTVTPSGRIKSWRLSLQTGGTSTCGYTACWQ